MSSDSRRTLYEKKCICANCFEDYAIRDFIYVNAEKERCDYCRTVASKPIAAPIDKVGGFIVERIETEWGDPNDEGVPWDSGEGGWVIPGVYDTYDLFFYELETIINDDFLVDLIMLEGDRQWCQRGFWSLTPSDELISSWHEFSQRVKHFTRYVFFRASDENNPFREPDKIPPSAMLDRLSNYIEKAGLIRRMNAGQTFIRVRIHDPELSFHTAKDLGAPPIEAARYSNRMSPAGIPMFYAALDEQTAIKETYQDTGAPAIATIAKFRTLKDLEVLDLTLLENVPSIFDSEREHKRQALIFLNAFVKEITIPIVKDGREHIEYVPTQVFTEYFRHVYKT